MGSKGRIPPPHLRRPLPSPGMLHPEAFGPGIRPPPGAFPFDMLPRPEIMEQKLAHQHMEMQRLATENERLAATHSSLRQQLAAAQQDLQRFQTRNGAVNSEQEQQLRVLKDKIAKMEADLKASEPVKVELQQARAEAQSLIAARQELISKVQQLTQDLQRSHADAQQIPALMSELDALRQEYQHCRATYDYERKLRIDHYESLQVMEKNYVSMFREVEKLRAELTNASNLDRSGASALGVPFGTRSAHKENDASGHHSVGQNAYDDGYGVPQGCGPSSGAAQYGGGPAGPASAQAGYDAPRGPTYDAPRNASYDASRMAGYGLSRGSNYEASRGAGSEAPRGSGYDAPRGTVVPQAAVSAGSTAAPYGSTQAPSPYGSAQVPSSYGSAQTPTRAGGGYEAPRGGNIARR
ncbi:protein FLX-like 2 [Phoenix dactylifera]|uniref:Protein FLX-like 2 n=1 Tax=Phoenix dactylifera TaxID=42345 RepID=A0A8B9AFC7_PHODC|nr:protein FLX-like 2 [Phoenix dactylifera]